MSSLAGLVGLAAGAGDGEISWPHFDSTTAAGLAIAILGNVLISLALNLQKLAHRRRERERSPTPSHSLDDVSEGDEESGVPETLAANPWGGASTPSLGTVGEGQPLLRVADPSVALSYGTEGGSAHDLRTRGKRGSRPWTVFLKWRARSEPQLDAEREDPTSNEEGDSYLKSKLWWTGFLLMNLGEIGNFISYGFAPASIVAPLGTFALVANCVFSPLILHERIRKRDLFGVAVAIVGAVTVVLSINASDARLTPAQLLAALGQRSFQVLTAVYVIGAVVLVRLSATGVGDRYVLVDVGCCALFGGFTVLSTKGVSTLLTTQGLRMFASWITYPIIVVLVATGVSQVRYLNRALMRFDSKVVIPAQFVLFNLSAIVGSAVLYGDFADTTFHRFVTFLYGCAATFAGVFVIASGSDADAAGSSKHQKHGSGDGEEGDGENEEGPVADVYIRAPGFVPQKINVVRPRDSVVSLVGLSPAQGLLLVHTPQLEEPPALVRAHSDTEYGRSTTQRPRLARRRGVLAE